jgi:hypothetical protein
MSDCHPSISPKGVRFPVFDEAIRYENNARQYANGARLLDVAGIRVTRQFKNYTAFVIESDSECGEVTPEPEWEDYNEEGVESIYSNPTQWGQDIIVNLGIGSSNGWFGAFYVPYVPFDPENPDEGSFCPPLLWGYIIAERIKIEQLPLQPVPIYLTDGDGITTLLEGAATLEYVRTVEDKEPWPNDDWEPTVDISDPEYNPTLAATLRIGYPPPIT